MDLTKESVEINTDEEGKEFGKVAGVNKINIWQPAIYRKREHIQNNYNSRNSERDLCKICAKVLELNFQKGENGFIFHTIL